ncbi:MAG: AraC family transcriptional regulator [Bacteroidota bacterium]
MIIKYEEYKLNDKSVFERVVFQPPFKPSVTYENEACFIYSKNGNGLSYGGLEKDNVVSKESILMKCGSFINHWQSADNGEPCEIIAIHFTPDIIKYVYQNETPSFLIADIENSSQKIFQVIPHSTIIDEYIKGMNFYFDNPPLINEELLILKIKELLLLLYNTNYSSIRDLLKSLFTPVELHFKSIINAHLFDDLSSQDLAALTNTSLTTFKRKFKEIFGESPVKYIQNKRLEKATELLKATHIQITDICYDCGFNSLSSFTRAFTKKYSKSPSKYREYFN